MSPDPRWPGPDDAGDPDPDPADTDPAGEAFVRSILAQHAEVGPIPGHVAERLDVALAAAGRVPEEAGTAEGAGLVTAGSGVTPLRRGTQPAVARGRLAGPARRLLVAAVGATVLAGGISLAVADRTTSDPASSTAGAAPGAASDDAASDDAERAAAGADSGEAAALPVTITASGRDYSPGSLTAAAGLLLSADTALTAPEPVARPDDAAQPGRAAPPGVPQVDVPPAPELDRLRDVMTLGVCARALADGGSGQVLAADLARYQGQAAAVLVLPGPDATVVDVWVVGPGCAPGDEQVLARARVPR